MSDALSVLLICCYEYPTGCLCSLICFSREDEAFRSVFIELFLICERCLTRA